MNAFPELLLALFLLAPLFFQAEKLIIWQQTFDYLFTAQVIYYTHANTFALFYKTIHLLLYRCLFRAIFDLSNKKSEFHSHHRPPSDDLM